MPSFSYDDEHRVSEVRFDGHKEFSRVEYRYDAVGRRTRKILHRHGRETENITFLWSGLRMGGESSSLTPERNTQYIYSENSREPLARVDSIGEQSETFWYHTELNGLPERMTDAHGEVVWRGRFSTWGETERESVTGFQAVPQNLRFQGQYLDRETGLLYNLFRYYDPVAGRFTQVDPIGLAGGLNTYAYAPNALNWIDPLGLSKCSSGTSLTVNKPKILKNPNLTNAERNYLERQFMQKQNALTRAAQRGELIWSPGTHDVRISSIQSSYRQAVSARYERIFGKSPDLTTLNADHPVDLIVGGSPTQRLQMLNESINKSVGSSLKNAGRKAGL